MDKKINWFIAPIILIIIVIAIDIVYYRKKKLISEKAISREPIVSQKTVIITPEATKGDINQGRVLVNKTSENKTGKESKKVSKKTSLKPKPAVSPEHTAKTFSIQVASFRKKSKANLLVNSLKKDGYDVYIATGNVPGKGIWYRVRIGKFSSKANAEIVLKKIKAKYADSFISE